MELLATKIFEKNYNSKARIVVNRGSSRSSKTYSLCQLFLLKALTEKNVRIIIVRKSLPTIRKTIFKDLKEVIIAMNLSTFFKLNHTHLYFTCSTTNSTIEFVSADDDEKFRGLEANYFWFNEATEIKYKFFQQAILRLTRKREDDLKNQFFLDFNPSNSKSWIKKEIEDKRNDIEIIHSTYRDNPFLTDDDIREINNLKEFDYDAWLVYSEGLWGEVRGCIFKNWELVGDIDTSLELLCVGLDFGFTNDPTAVVKVWRRDDVLFVKQMIYKTGLTNPDIVDEMKRVYIPYNVDIICDNEPKSVEEINRLGYKRARAIKNKDINLSIDILKRFKIKIIKPSTELIDEMENYVWLENNEGLINKPVDKNNHLIDALRYVALEKLYIKPVGSGVVFRTLKNKNN